MDRARKRKEQRNKINCQQHDVPFTEMRFHDADPASFTNSVPCSQAIQILVIVELGRAREKVLEKAMGEKRARQINVTRQCHKCHIGLRHGL